MNYPKQTGGHSSKIHGWLVVGEQRLPLAEVGPGFCTLKSPTESDSTEGELIIEVDDTTRIKKVQLPNGIKADSTRVSLA